MARREALKRHNETAPIALSNLTPITKYYSAADKVLDQFKKHLDAGELDDAYIIGRRFALFSTVSLPKHHYYTSPNHASLRLKNQKDAAWVTTGIERIVQVMDKQELQKQQQEEERIWKEKEEEQRKQAEWQTKTRQRLLAVNSSGLGELDSNDSALDMDSKLARLNALFPKEGVNNVAESSTKIVCDNELPLPPPMAPPADIMSNQDLALFYSSSAMQQLKSDGGTPMFAEAEPPIFSDLFLDTLRTPTVDESALPHPIPTAPTPKIPVRQLRRKYSNEFESLQSSKQIEIMKLSTYQGRLSSTPRYDSTNGCTVISPLVVATHINPEQIHKNSFPKPTIYKRGITNTEINDIIDNKAPPILQTVRSKLGLDQHALIIPSDVHDYLVDQHILPQEKFVGVCGGDILDPKHWQVLVDMLCKGREDAKVDSRMLKIGAGECCVLLSQIRMISTYAKLEPNTIIFCMEFVSIILPRSRCQYSENTTRKWS